MPTRIARIPGVTKEGKPVPCAIVTQSSAQAYEIKLVAKKLALPLDPRGVA